MLPLSPSQCLADASSTVPLPVGSRAVSVSSYSALDRPSSFTVVPTGRLDILKLGVWSSRPRVGLVALGKEIKFETPGSRAAH